jgi:ubiquinone/menaquinone biosynthesis C-methylase UbiE
MNRYFPLSLPVLLLVFLQLISGLAASQEQSVRPGINRHYQDPEWDQWVNAFERPGREVFDQRHAIVAAAGVRQGMDLADIGAGTGLFTRLFASQVGPEGTVYAVDISETFVRNILRTSTEQGLSNVKGIVNTARDAALPENSIDLAFLSDTYHHFEYPQDMLASIRHALRDGGRLVIVDFRRHPGVSSRWVMGHVRADMNEVIEEVKAAGFKFLEEKPLLDINYFLEFEKRTAEQSP